MIYKKGYKIVHVQDGKYYSCFAGRKHCTPGVKRVEYKVGEFSLRHDRKDGGLAVFVGKERAISWLNTMFAAPKNCEVWECRYKTTSRKGSWQRTDGIKRCQGFTVRGTDFATAVKLVKRVEP